MTRIVDQRNDSQHDVTSMTLFDASTYGPERTHREPKPATPAEIRLAKPWVLLGQPGHEPRAHILVANAQPNRHDAWRARCGQLGYIIPVDGHPLARVCRACQRLA